MKNTKTNWILGAVALLVLPLILQSFGNAWVRIATSKMAFLVTSPISITTPMMENIDSVERNINSASTTPISVSGSEVMSASGCKKLLNWLARIMSMKMMAMASAEMA